MDDVYQLVIKRAPSCKRIGNQLKQAQLMENLTHEHRYYMAMCGLFNDKDRDVLELWSEFEDVFKTLMEKDKLGQQHLMQAFILFFVVKYPSQKKKAVELCKKTKSLFPDTWFKQFGESKLKLDKNCVLKNIKAEHEFRNVISEFLKEEGANLSEANQTAEA